MGVHEESYCGGLFEVVWPVILLAGSCYAKPGVGIDIIPAGVVKSS